MPSPGGSRPTRLWRPAILVTALILHFSSLTFAQVSFTEFSAPGISGLTNGPDGALWFIANSVIARMSTSGAITYPAGTAPLVTGGVLLDITNGPDGNLWIATSTSPHILRVSPGGSVAGFDPPGFTFVLSLAPGNDGNVWFGGDNGVGRITPSGTITTFGGEGSWLARGTDGNVWFMGGFSMGVSRITPAGVISEVTPLRAIRITAGPDGNMWFSRTVGSQVVRVTPGGAVTGFALPTAGANALAISTGPDGNVWFTELQNRLGRITPAGVITEFPIPSEPFGNPPGGPGPLIITGPTFMVNGPDGRLWFTTPDRIIRASVPIVAPVPALSNTALAVCGGLLAIAAFGASRLRPA